MRHLLIFSFVFLFISCGGDDEMTPPVTAPRVSIQDLSVNEGNSDNNAFIRCQLDKSSDRLISISISSSDVSASSPEDFTSFENITLEFQPGSLSTEYQMQIKGDEDFENDETFEVKIVSTDGIGINKETAVVTILNDDPSDVELTIPETGYTTPETYPGLTLLWQDEFDGDVLNESDWTFEIGAEPQWGNNELQFYRKENTSLQEGHLVIEARKESFAGKSYTSSRIITRNKFDFKYGRVDIRANLPYGQGIWPALWMLGSNLSTVGWPACGEIDIMEIVGHEANRVHGTAHWANTNGDRAQFGDSWTLPSGIFNDEFHVFSIVWNASQIKWYVDDIEYHVMDTSPSSLDEFRENFFFIFNVAVGGDWPGSPDGSTIFPQWMIVDYIRVFQ